MPQTLWLEDFNDPPPHLALPEPEPEPDPLPEPVSDPRLEGWHEGFIAGHRRAIREVEQRKPALTEQLIGRLRDLETKLEAIAADSAAQMGGLLVDMLRHAVPEDWPDTVKDRLAQVIEAVRPSFYLDPKLFLHLDTPGQLDFADLPGFARRLETLETTDWAVTIRWDVEKLPETVLPALRAAVAGEDQASG
ncbi:MAG TPA: hypothetical protein VHB27_15575 [Rhodopila sp.]|uniref:hypothetical protein n=1 Tax=Rhodopila sp. TaxID=2480087 RepID=UPI002BD3B2A5|nr:hypothetical protein [Rhodopila sp.]HVY16644.1 hypothetical protein [Rhodopila sp.]